MNNNYAQKVELLLRMMPIITDEGVFAVHGGSAILWKTGRPASPILMLI
jgi:hypothetical protein